VIFDDGTVWIVQQLVNDTEKRHGRYVSWVDLDDLLISVSSLWESAGRVNIICTGENRLGKLERD
jgi:hypothetical protein